MAIPRSAGSTLTTLLPPMRRSPALICSSPAIIRSKVDLPQPDGPTKTQNSPSAISRSMPLMIEIDPKDFRTPRNCTSASASLPLFQLQQDCRLWIELRNREPVRRQ